MTTYAIFMTFVFGFMTGGITVLSVGAWMDGRDEKRRAQARAAYHAKYRSSSDFSEETDASMNEAVALVQEKLGGTVISDN